jgi:hypothetical protein
VEPLGGLGDRNSGALGDELEELVGPARAAPVARRRWRGAVDRRRPPAAARLAR